MEGTDETGDAGCELEEINTDNADMRGTMLGEVDDADDAPDVAASANFCTSTNFVEIEFELELEAEFEPVFASITEDETDDETGVENNKDGGVDSLLVACLGGFKKLLVIANSMPF